MDAALRQAIARIDILQGDKSLSRGTGFLIAPNLVLTALHVVADRASQALSLYPGRIALTFPGFTTDAIVVEGRWDRQTDWILLTCATAPSGLRPIPLAESAADGEAWETYGFPDANPRDGMVQTGTVENASGTFEGVKAYQLFSKQAAAGMGAPVKGLSGGPVIAGGAIIGLLRSSLMREGQNVAGTLYGCPVETVLDRCADLLPIPDPCRGLPGLPRRSLPAVPFRFLDRFTADDAEIFFGRNREIRELYDRVTSDESPQVVLLYGQSGAGKSSFLDAGLLPRLGAAYSSVYLRRDRAKGLLRTLIDALAPALPAVSAAHASLPPAEALRLAWLGTETAAGRPLVVVLDQVEEVFTLPSGDGELVEFVETLALLLEGPAKAGHYVPTADAGHDVPSDGAGQPVLLADARPSIRGRLVLGFRKEWFAEIQKQLDARGIEYSKVFLEALGADAVSDVVAGLAHTKRLRERYGLRVEPGLAEAMARDLTADRDSPVAPTLQVLLSRMWRDATAASSSAPAFTVALYERITNEGTLLVDFLDQQLATLARSAIDAGGSRADVVESGLALDVLRFHISRLGTAEERSARALVDEYQRDDDVTWLVGELKRLYLLSEPAGDAPGSAPASRLANTLAQAVRLRFDESMRPGQRARRIIESRAGEWMDGRTGAPLDALDLARAEQGLTGMRTLHPDEERLLAASRVARHEAVVAVQKRRMAARAALSAVVVAAAVAGWLFLENVRQNRWRELLALDARVPTMLLMNPVNALVASITLADQSLDLSGGVLPGIQANLAHVLDQARERISWPSDGEVSALAFSSDGRVAAGTFGGLVQVFSVATPDAVERIQVAGSAVPVMALSFSDDGELLAAALGRQGVGVWNRQRQPMETLPDQPDGTATTAEFAPGGRVLVATYVSSSGATTLYVCDIDRQTSTRFPIATEADVASLATGRTSSGDLLIATAGGDLRVWYPDGRLRLGPVSVPDVFIDSVALSIAPHPGIEPAHDDVLIAGGGTNGTFVVWNVSHHPRVDGPYMTEGSAGMRVAFGREGRFIFIGGADGLMRTYNTQGERVMPPFAAAGSDGAVVALAASPDGESVVTSGRERGADYVRIVDMVGTELHFPLTPPTATTTSDKNRINTIAFLPREGVLLVGGLGRTVARWAIEVVEGSGWSQPAYSAIDARQAETTVIAASTNGRVAAFGGPEAIYFLEPDGQLSEPAPVMSTPRSAAMSSDGATLVTGDEAGGVTLWDVAARTVTRRMTPHVGWVHAVAFSAAGDRFVTGGADGKLILWRRDGTSLRTVEMAPGTEVTSAAFHPDGSFFVGSDGGEVQHLMQGGDLIASLPVLRDQTVNGLAVTPSGGSLMVGSRSGVRLLDLASNALLDLDARGHTGALEAMALSADGGLLAGVDQLGDVRLWRANWREWIAEGCARLKSHPVFTRLDTAAPVPTRQGINARAARDACTRRIWAAP